MTCLTVLSGWQFLGRTSSLGVGVIDAQAVLMAVTVGAFVTLLNSALYTSALMEDL